MAEIFEQGDLVVLYLSIYDVNNVLIDPDGYAGGTEPTVTVKDPYGVTQQTAQLAIRVSQGYYKFEYQLDIKCATGYWAYEWMFTVTGNTYPVLSINARTERFVVVNPGTSTFVADALVNNLRILLKDNHPDYRKQRWTDTELQVFIENALWDINVTPPAITYFFLDNYYNNVPDWKSLIMTGAQVFALIAQGTFEIGKEFSYGDNGISITIDRSGKYQGLANMILTNYETKKTLVKKQYFMKTISPQVINSGELEQRLRTYAPQQFRIR